MGNPLLWIAAFALFIFMCIEMGRGRKHTSDHRSIMIMTLIVGYLANYLPFFLIHRPMYLYHYFSALIFLFLLAGYALPLAIDRVSSHFKERGAVRIATAMIRSSRQLGVWLMSPDQEAGRDHRSLLRLDH